MSDLQSSIFNPNDAAKIACDTFKRIQVVTQPLGGSLIAWELKPGFCVAGPYNFFVDFGYSGTDKWEPLNTIPLVNVCTYFDINQRYWDHLAPFYYRIRLITPNVIDPNTGQPQIHISQPQQANGLWSKRDWLLAREISRKEYLVQRKATNKTAVGYLLKRRRFGPRCTTCLEWDTQSVQKGQCPECYGTGFIGGYFPGIDYTITMDVSAREFKLDPQIGNRNDIIKLGRAVAYPFTDTNDVFLRRDNGERYFVNQIKNGAEVGGIPIIVFLELRLAPVTDIIYTIPVTGGASSSSNSSGSSGSSAPSEPSESEANAGLNDGLENW